MKTPTTIIGDWGTTRLRLYLVRGGAVCEVHEGPGIGQLSAPPAATLEQALQTMPDDEAPVFIGGMAGSRTGIVETAYADCPASFADWARTARRIEVAGRPVTVAGGLAMRGRTADVMRGEEAQIFGCLRLNPHLQSGRHRLLLPGTHSKHCLVDNGTITGFRTHFTGELFGLLTRHSTLLSLGQADEAALDADGFATGVEQAGEGDALAHLFAARARQLLDAKSPDWARGYLSGLLIGAELRLARAPDAGQVTLIGDARLCARYGAAAHLIGIAHAFVSGEDSVIAGLSLLAAGIEEGVGHVD